MTGDHGRLRRLLGEPDTAWIVDRVRTRLSRGTPLSGTITLSESTPSQRKAAGRLLGRQLSAGRSLSVSLDRVDDILRTSGAWPDGLASAVVALTGPIEDTRQRQAEADAWREVDDRLEELAAARPVLADWLGGLRSRGHFKRVSTDADEALTMVRDLRLIVDALPTTGESLAGFAARVLHRAHALDAGTPLGNLAANAAEIIGRPRTRANVDAAARSGTAAWRRASWDSVGVLVDDLSSTVLTLNLPGALDTSSVGASPTAVALSTLSSSGQPAILTLRQVESDSLGDIPPVVYVCENPAVVSAAADRLGASASPLVCVQGQPGRAATDLLCQLAAAGASVRYHSDFDWGGVTIANTLSSHIAWTPWRFTAADYLNALDARESAQGLPPLTGTPAETAWDPQLRKVMTEQGVRIEEELVLDVLLSDLSERISGE